MRPSRRLVLAAALLAVSHPAHGRPAVTPGAAPRGLGPIVRHDPALDALIDPDAQLEVLGEGYSWSEGPVWIADGAYLLFSDVPENRIHKWSEQAGVSLFMEPSGLAGPDASRFREPGSNGLIAGPAGSILMADHGNRAIARVDLASRAKTLLATHHAGLRFNSPNDLVQARNGSLYFTDPPYGLKDLDRSPLKEMPCNGVYRLDPDGGVALLEAGLTFPNGIALSPDQSTLYVAVSDPGHAVIMAYDLGDDGQTSGGRVLRDFTALVGPENPGLPDGLAIDRAGHLFATGPGGVHVLRPDGQTLGRIDTGGAAANCTFGAVGRTLFITAGSRLLRLRTLTSG
jgi:gluconolactonase